MTQVRRAKNYFVYLMALMISSLFSIFGRSAPSWAEETTTQRNATVFQQLMQTTQGTVQNRIQKPANSIDNRDVKLNGPNNIERDYTVTNNNIERDFAGTSNIERNIDYSRVSDGYTSNNMKPFLNKAFAIDKDVDPAWLNAQNERFNFLINSIKDKVERGENLNDVELLYFNTLFRDYVEKSVEANRYIGH